MTTFQINHKILTTMNECNRESFYNLLDEVNGIPNIFRSKRYLWNWIRTRDFYKMIAEWIAHNVEERNDQNLPVYDGVIHEIIDTTPNVKIRKTFVWNLLKRAPILTCDTIRYASNEKIHSILQSDVIYTDEHIQPFLEEIRDLRIAQKRWEDYT